MNAKKKILIVGPSWVGDMVMAQSLFKLLKLQSPEMIIDVIAPEWSLPITERMPEVNNSINSLSKHNHLNLKAIFEIARGIKTAAYDQAIILPRSLKSALIPWLAKIPIRTGYRGEMRYGIINDIRAFNRNTQDQTVKRYAALGFKKMSKEPSIIYPKLDVSIKNCKRIFKEIKDKDPASVSLNGPDGILPQVQETANKISEKFGIPAYVLADTTWGTCDMNSMGSKVFVAS